MKNKVKKNVYLLGIVSFLNDISSEMIMPILPIFITSLGGTGLIVGLIGGLRDSISSLLKVLFGYLSDKVGKRKVFVSLGYISSSIFKFLLSFAKTWQNILLFASLERIGKGIRTAPRDAIIADSSSKERGKNFGIHRFLDTSGAIIGSFLVFVLFWYLSFNFNVIILLASIFSFLSIIPLLFVADTKVKRNNIEFKKDIKNLSKNIKFFILVSSIYALSNFSYMFFILKSAEVMSNNNPTAFSILLYILFNIFYAIFAIPFGKLADKYGKEKILSLGYLLFSLTTIGFIFLNNLYGLIILFILYGITNSIINSNQRAYISDLSSQKLRATTLGIYHTIIGLIALPSSIIAGFFWQINSNLTFIFSSILSLLAFLLMSMRKVFKYNI